LVRAKRESSTTCLFETKGTSDEIETLADEYRLKVTRDESNDPDNLI
jgi:hypothetical protein